MLPVFQEIDVSFLFQTLFKSMELDRTSQLRHKRAIGNWMSPTVCLESRIDANQRLFNDREPGMSICGALTSLKLHSEDQSSNLTQETARARQCSWASQWL